ADGLLRLTQSNAASLRAEALRALINTKRGASQRKQLEQLAQHQPGAGALVARVLGKPFAKARPPSEDIQAWLKRLAGPADVAAGRRIFFPPKPAAFYPCPPAQGGGNRLGPDLSTICPAEPGSTLGVVL